MARKSNLGPTEYSHTMTVRDDGRFKLEITGLYEPQARAMLHVLFGPHVDHFYGGILSQGCEMPESEEPFTEKRDTI